MPHAEPTGIDRLDVSTDKEASHVVDVLTHPAVAQLLCFHNNGPAFLPWDASVRNTRPKTCSEKPGTQTVHMTALFKNRLNHNGSIYNETQCVEVAVTTQACQGHECGSISGISAFVYTAFV